MIDSVGLTKQQVRVLQSLNAGGWIIQSDRNGKQSFFVAMPGTQVTFYVSNANFWTLSNLGYVKYFRHYESAVEFHITPEGRKALRDWEAAK